MSNTFGFPQDISARLGCAAIAAGVFSALLLPLPIYFLIALPLSGLGWMIGVAGIVIAALHHERGLFLAIAGEALSACVFFVSAILILAAHSPS